MNIKTKAFRVLGLAFMLQFITSFFLSAVLTKSFWLVSSDISATILKIADNPNLLGTDRSGWIEITTDG